MASAIVSLEEQRDIIKALITTTTLTITEKAHLISNTWMFEWELYVTYDHIPSNSPIESIGPINNTTLLDEDGELKAKLKESQDYRILTTPVWNQLFLWYGGGPDLPFDCIEDGADVKARVDFYYVNPLYGGVKKRIRADNETIVLDLRKAVMKLFDVPEDTEARLIDFYQERWVAAMNDKETLAKYRMFPDQTIVLDTRAPGARWGCRQTSISSDDEAGWRPAATRSYGQSLGPGKCGLINLGNTCYFNSGVQCLMHTMPLILHFLNNDWKAEINTANRLGSGGDVVKDLGALVEEFWRGSHSIVDPSSLKYSIGRFAHQFSGWQQQDAHELLIFLLDAIHEDLNRCLTKPIVEGVVGDSTNDDAIAAQAWAGHRQRHDSVIVDLFHGQLRSTLLCPACHQTTVVFDPYAALSLPVTRPKLATVTVHAVFIPLNFEPRSAITLVLPVSPTPEQLSAAVSTLLGRPLKVVMGQKDTANSALSWTLTGLDGEESRYAGYYGYYQRPDPLYFVFEVDDSAPFWVPCQLKIDVRRPYAGYSQEEVVLGPFLVPCADANVRTDDVARAAEPLLVFLWRTDEPPRRARAAVTPSSPSLLSSSSSSSDDDYDDPTEEPGIADLPADVKAAKESFGKLHWSQSRAKFVPIATYYDTWVTADYTHPSLASTTVDLRVNGRYAGRFSFVALARRHVSEAAVVPEPSAHASAGSSAISLATCFGLFGESEKLDENNEWFCPGCRTFVQADKKIDIWSVPEVCLIHLKRFSGSGVYSHKVETLVDFPDELDLAPYVVGPQPPEDLLYVLYAVSEHSGSTMGGHYTAHAVVASGDAPEWYSFNDSSCYGADAAGAHSELAYVLFYQRKSTTGVLIPAPPRQAPAPVFLPLRRSSSSSSDSWPTAGTVDQGTATSSSSSSDEDDKKDTGEGARDGVDHFGRPRVVSCGSADSLGQYAQDQADDEGTGHEEDEFVGDQPRQRTIDDPSSDGSSDPDDPGLAFGSPPDTPEYGV
jgi:ubiquitin carboxyl-terminal hydrolase 4/11/15